MAARGFRCEALAGIGEIAPGTEVSAAIVQAAARQGALIEAATIVVVAQKIVSKAEGRYVDLAQVEPSPRARELSLVTGKDPRLVEVVLRESTAVLRARRDVLVVRHRRGYVLANAGVDRSNLAPSAAERCLLLPEDPMASAAALRTQLSAQLGVAPGVIISDSFGRPWRRGVVCVALASAGIAALVDLRGLPDRAGRRLEATEVAFADAVAAAAGLAMGEASEGTPVVLVSGLGAPGPEIGADTLVRPLEEDLFQ